MVQWGKERQCCALKYQEEIEMGVLTYNKDHFLMDGKPYLVLSGAMHYFRIPRAYWHDRLLKLKECGLNTVETYTCWNLHEPREGEFDFSGELDIVAYVREAQALGLNVILRPGPYICAEFEFGGLPAWLLNYEHIRLRCNDPLYLSKMRRYYTELLTRLRPYFASNGGNIIMLQIENEYGSYGNDKDYLRAVVDIYRDNQIDCLFFTSDGANYTMLYGGTLDGHLATANFGSKAREKMTFLKEQRPDQPLMCAEFWCGWFEHWREQRHIRDAEDYLKEFRDFLDMGASVNLYMFHGGTNFGFTNGANYDPFYQPTITSYDYGAPLSEAGDRTPGYYQLRDAICKKLGSVPALTAQETPKAAYGRVALTEQAGLFDNLERLSKPVYSPVPLWMEEVGQNFGYILYRNLMQGPMNDWTWYAEQVHDRAQVFVDGTQRAVWERWDPESQERAALSIPLAHGEQARLDILVENMGRVNYGPKLMDRKGIQGVRSRVRHQMGWEIYPLPMEDLSGLQYLPVEQENSAALTGPVFLRGYLTLDTDPCDTFMRLDGFTKGFVVVNGHNLGRYWNPAGPQKTLYVPAPFLQKGRNEIVVFESDRTERTSVELLAAPDLG